MLRVTSCARSSGSFCSCRRRAAGEEDKPPPTGTTWKTTAHQGGGRATCATKSWRSTPQPIPCPTPCCPRARPACCPATLVSSPSHCVRRCTPIVPLALYTPLPCALTSTAGAQNARGDHRRLGQRSSGKRGLRQAHCARALGCPSMGELCLGCISHCGKVRCILLER